MKTLSLVVCCFNEADALPLFYTEACRVLDTLPAYQAEFVFVDDGSTDHTLSIIKQLAASDPRVHFVSFSRNFGKEAALLAGLEAARGDFIATLDADLQDPPSLLPEMLALLPSYDVIATRRVNRKGEPPIRSFFARRFYKLINRISDTEMVDGARDFRLMTRPVVDAIISCPEYNRYSKGLWSFVGFKTHWLEYENIQRAAGETKWSFWKLFKYAIEGIVAFSTLPLTISALIGALLCLISLVFIIVIIIKTLTFGDPVSGWPSLACLIMFLGGIQLFFLGIIGEYLAKTYLETKHRPIYIIREAHLAPQSNRPSRHETSNKPNRPHHETPNKSNHPPHYETPN